MLITQATGTNSFTVTFGLDETVRKIIRLKSHLKSAFILTTLRSTQERCWQHTSSNITFPLIFQQPTVAAIRLVEHKHQQVFTRLFRPLPNKAKYRDTETIIFLVPLVVASTSSGKKLVCGQKDVLTDRHDEANGRYSKFYEKRLICGITGETMIAYIM
jgi:hypothetical protein